MRAAGGARRDAWAADRAGRTSTSPIPCRDFAQTDEALRIRTVGDTSFVTYKGPKLDATTKTRRELELPLRRRRRRRVRRAAHGARLHAGGDRPQDSAAVRDRASAASRSTARWTKSTASAHSSSWNCRPTTPAWTRPKRSSHRWQPSCNSAHRNAAAISKCCCRSGAESCRTRHVAPIGTPDVCTPSVGSRTSFDPHAAMAAGHLASAERAANSNGYGSNYNRAANDLAGPRWPDRFAAETDTTDVSERG